MTELSGRIAGKDRELMQSLIQRVTFESGTLLVDLDTSMLAQELGLPMAEESPPTLSLRSDMLLRRTRRAMRLVTNNGLAVPGDPDVALVKLVARAHRWWRMLRTGSIDVTRLAAKEGVTRSYLTRVTRLAFLGPELIDDIIGGRLPAHLGARLLTASGAITLSWNEQRATFLCC